MISYQSLVILTMMESKSKPVLFTCGKTDRFIKRLIKQRFLFLFLFLFFSFSYAKMVVIRTRKTSYLSVHSPLPHLANERYFRNTNKQIKVFMWSYRSRESEVILIYAREDSIIMQSIISFTPISKLDWNKKKLINK